MRELIHIRRRTGAEVGHSIQREERLRRLRPVQTRITINRTKAAPRTISQGSSVLRPLAMAWWMTSFGFNGVVVVVVVESTGHASANEPRLPGAGAGARSVAFRYG